jgi:malate dehydrogenase
MSQVVTEVVRVAPEAILIVVSNPLDAMCHVALKRSGFPRERVIGMAGVLDSARFRAFLAWELGVSVEDVQAMVLGGHGDTMVPLPNYATVSGIPITQLLSPEKIDRLARRTRFGGGEVLGLLKFGGAYYAPAAATAQMVEAILRDKKRILPCAVYLQGEYGLSGIFLGVPVKLGRRGGEGIIEIALSEGEKAALAASAEAVRGLVDKLGAMGL